MKTIQLLAILCLSSLTISAQEFMPGFEMFSHKKPAYITLEDGTKVEGEIDKVKRKKNNIAAVEMIIDGEEKTYDPADIKEMYLPANGLNKLSLKIDNATNTSKDYDLDMLNEGYGYFIKTDINLGKKEDVLLMQLVNPGFDSKIKVFFDPMAMETGTASVGVMKAGGVDKSYFIKIGDEMAQKITKKEYKTEFKTLFASCPSLIKEIGKKPDWKEFAAHVHTFDSCE
ncbi:hypothetical protein [Jiulongibacter sp. NS-SX5]|uniref:hypothetical protein n=1 Tax=Jiulongibacter sp. NS-SX5 TaxID=3463854 RepID=UPI004059149B